MNIKKLRKLEKWILEEPRRFNMMNWAGSKHIIAIQKPPCGTVGCLAGMTCHMEGYKLRPGDSFVTRNENVKPIVAAAMELLGLDNWESARLFYLSRAHHTAIAWPRKFEIAYNKAKTFRAKAEVAVARIEHFIKTKGLE